MYRTGDKGCRLSDGSIDFWGRIDDQVKVRGYRVEPAEVAQALREHPELVMAEVLARKGSSGEMALVAYIQSEQKIESEELRVFLANTLPAYLIPSYFVPVAEFPLTSNGKLDRKALPSPKDMLLERSLEHLRPLTDTEGKLAEIWSELLGVDQDQIGIHHNFFDLGGHSLKMIQLLSRINNYFLVQINIQDLFAEATIENIAGHIDFIIDQSNKKATLQKSLEIDF